jgi:hypothetical protein
MTCDPIMNSAATENNPVRGCISIEKHVPLLHNPVRGCTSQHDGAPGHKVEHLRRSVTVGKRVLLICKP